MAYEYPGKEEGLDLSDIIYRKNPPKEEPTIHNLNTPLPRTYGEILRDVNPAVVNYAFLGTALLLKTAHVILQKGKSLIFKNRPNYYYDPRVQAMYENLEPFSNPFASYTPEPGKVSLDGLGQFGASPSTDESNERASRFSVTSEPDVPELSDEAFHAIQKMVAENSEIRNKYGNDKPSPSLTDAEAMVLNKAARMIETYLKKNGIGDMVPVMLRSASHHLFQRLSTSGYSVSAGSLSIIDNLRFLPSDKIEAIRKLLGGQESVNDGLDDADWSEEVSLGFLKD